MAGTAKDFRRPWQRGLAWLYRISGLKSKALAYIKAGDYQKGSAALLRLAPAEDPEVLEKLAYCYGCLKKYELCITYYLEAWKLVPQNGEIPKNLAAAYAGKGEYPQALEIIKGLLRANPGETELFNNLAWIYEKCGKFQEAEENYYRSLALAGLDPQVIHNLVCCLKKQRKYFEAMEAVNLLLKIPEATQLAYESQAQIYESLDMPEKAVACYNKALGLE